MATSAVTNSLMGSPSGGPQPNQQATSFAATGGRVNPNASSYAASSSPTSYIDSTSTEAADKGAVPSLLRENTGLIQTASPQDYVTPEMMVENQMTSILSQDSNYMKQAEARGRAQNQAKGWEDSTAGIKAIEASRIAAALPMAQQNSATWKTMYENEQTSDMARDIATHQFGFQKQLQNMNITSQERQAYTAVMGSAMDNVMQGIMGIMNNPSITNKDVAYKNVWDAAQGWMKTGGNILGYNIDFSNLNA